MKKTTFYIVGKHAVTEALKNPNRNILRVFFGFFSSLKICGAKTKPDSTKNNSTPRIDVNSKYIDLNAIF